MMNNYSAFDDKIHCVTKFRIVGDYAIHLTFDDGVEQEIDFSSILIGPVFGPLQDLNLFNQVQLDKRFGTLEWPTGADIDPALLYHWQDHVDAIVEQRQRQFAVPA